MKDFFFETSPYQWNRPGNPSIYATTPMCVDKLFAELKKHDKYSEKDILAFVTYSLVKVTKSFPRINSYFFMKKRVTRKGIKLSFMVKSDNPESSLFIQPIDFTEDITIGSLRKKIYTKIEKVRQDPLYSVRFSSNLMRLTPGIFRNIFFSFFYFLSKQKLFKFIHKACPHDLFGSVIISYVGSLGLPSAYIPLLKHGTNSMILAVGKVEKKLEFDENKNVIEKKYLQLSWTIDHRLTHGEELSRYYKAIKKIFDNPELFFKKD